MDMPINSCRSYASLAGLERALKIMDLFKANPIVVLNEKHRYTAIFPVARCDMVDIHWGIPVHHGFMIVN
jgi:hypothetical protein